MNGGRPVAEAAVDRHALRPATVFLGSGPLSLDILANDRALRRPGAPEP